LTIKGLHKNLNTLRIQVSEATYQHLKDHYAFESRGTLHIKGRGPMTTYLYSGPLCPSTPQ
jgi:class 3 adenylate cyclase